MRFGFEKNVAYLYSVGVKNTVLGCISNYAQALCEKYLNKLTTLKMYSYFLSCLQIKNELILGFKFNKQAVW